MGSTTLWTPDQLAEYLGISVRSLYNWKYKGLGPKTVKVGSRLRYRWGDIEDWLDATSASDKARS
ncbi:helix-turn-helix transcriptional regulator [Streptomyces virginiae]|uniref:helix-turn-helix transcriptional regulator n=1 Tax=Streptomyces virginiae TaxID=1961 RepID=UPI003796D5BA